MPTFFETFFGYSLFSSGANAAVSFIAPSTYKTFQDAINVFNSTGIISGGAISDNGDGTIAITAGSGAIRSSDSNLITLQFFDFIAITNLTLTDNSINYVYVNYNSGVPNVTALTTRSTDFNSKILLGQIYRAGTALSINSSVKQISANAVDLLWRAGLEIMPFANSSGSMISEVGTRNIALTAGAWWNGLVNFMTPAFDSSAAGRFTYWYRNGSGGWTSIATQAQINNTQYDNNSGTLATLTNGNYGVHWIFIEVSGAIHVVFGQGDYNLVQATDANIPGTLPPIISANGRILAKIVILKSASTFTSLDSALENSFQFSQPTIHNSLAGLQGGSAGEYYHLNSAQYTSASNIITAGFAEAMNQSVATAASPTWVGAIFSGATANELLATDGSKALLSLTTATYPSLTEISYVKGVTSALQTQLDAKQPLASGLTDIAALAVTNNNIIVANGTNWVAKSDAAARSSLGLTIGSDVQAFSVNLANLSTYANLGGFLTLIGFANFVGRNIVGTTNQIDVTNGNGIGGNPTFALSANITGITSISATTFTGALSGNATTATALATARTISISGDLSYTSPSFDGSSNVTAAGTLATVNANVGSFGSATQVGSFTVNAKGLITAASNVTITPAVGSITGLGTSVATALAVNVGTAGAFVINGGALGTPSAGTLTNCTGLPVAGGGTGLSSGTSGGIPYFSSSSAMTSSAALAAGGIVYGGGAGSAPATNTSKFFADVSNTRLGIGNASPSFIADFVSANSQDGVRVTAVDFPQIRLDSSTQAAAGYMAISRTANGFFTGTTANSLLFSAVNDMFIGTFSTLRASFLANGNSGIATNNPASKWHISGGGVQDLIVGNAGSFQQLLIGNNGSSYGTIDSLLQGTGATQLRLNNSGGEVYCGGALKVVTCFGRTVGVSGVPVVVDNTGAFGTVVSSREFKDGIEPIQNSELIYDLNPVQFFYKSDSEKNIHVGLIAEDVLNVIPSMVIRDKSGKINTVNYPALVPYLLAEIKKLNARISQLEAK